MNNNAFVQTKTMNPCQGWSKLYVVYKLQFTELFSSQLQQTEFINFFGTGNKRNNMSNIKDDLRFILFNRRNHIIRG